MDLNDQTVKTMNRYKQCSWNKGKHWILKRKLSKVDKTRQHCAVSMAWGKLSKFKENIGQTKKKSENILGTGDFQISSVIAQC